MRLLNAETFETEDFFDGRIPPYTILSHTWGDEKDEITFCDIKIGRIKDAAARPTKLAGCCERTRMDGYKYTWIDTCCINKTSAVELGEAINSMFRWYANASICYAYLSDIPPSGTVDDTKSAISSSRWFTRGWTLQELLAPRELHFFGSTWSFLGTRSELSTTIERITGISRPFLLSLASLHEASVAQRMAWASKRVTKRKEDIAYCLLGIFDVTMPMIYGEGEQSFLRLQQAIIAHTDDDSILAWGFNSENVVSVNVANHQISGILASMPADFANCAHVVSLGGGQASLEISGGRLRARLPLYTTSAGETYCLLNCRPESDIYKILGVPLARNSASGLTKEYFRPQGLSPTLFPITTESRTRKIEILMGHRRKAEVGLNRQNWFYIEDSSQIGLDVVEVHPALRWQKTRSIITTDDVNDDRISGTQQTLVRLRSKGHSTSDFIMLLEFDALKSIDGEARCHVMICSKDTTLKRLSQALDYLSPKISGKQDASNGILNLRAVVSRKSVVGQLMFTVQLGLMRQPPRKTVDATEELKLIQLHRRGTKSWFPRISGGAKKSDGVRQHSHRIQELEATIKDLRRQNTELTNRLLNFGGSTNNEARVEAPEPGFVQLNMKGVDSGLKASTGTIPQKDLSERLAYSPSLFACTAQPIIVKRKQDDGMSSQNFQPLVEQGQFEKITGYRTPYKHPAIFSQNGRLVAVDATGLAGQFPRWDYDQKGQVHIWKSNRTGRFELIQELELPDIEHKPAGLSPDGRLLATYDCYKHMMYLFRSDLEDRFEMAQELEILENPRQGYSKYPAKAIFSHKNNRLVVTIPEPGERQSDGPRTTQIWEPDPNGLFRKVQLTTTTYGSTLSLSPCSQKLAVGYQSSRVEIWGFDRQGMFQQAQVIEFIRNQSCSSVAFSPDGQRFAVSFVYRGTASGKDGFQIWKADRQGEFHQEQEQLWLTGSSISLMTFSSDGYWLAFQVRDHGWPELQTWASNQHGRFEQAFKFRQLGYPIHSIVFLEGSRRIALEYEDHYFATEEQDDIYADENKVRIRAYIWEVLNLV